MVFSDQYRRQVALLIRTIPTVAKEDCFALKGGTAINLFVRDLPRLSVDIDLTYLPRNDRKESLMEIEVALNRIAANLETSGVSVHITKSAPRTQTEITKLVVRSSERVQVKIEVTPVLRGTVYAPGVMRVSENVAEEFGFAEANVVSFADLYAGKITAALDRQHPRDLFDVHLLLAEEGLDSELRTALIVYLICHNHWPHQLLSTACRDITHDFQHSFLGMTQEFIDQETLVTAHRTLTEEVLGKMPDAHKRFLISFYRRNPEWSLLESADLDQLPAVRWRELNLDRAGKETRETAVRKLEQVLWP